MTALPRPALLIPGFTGTRLRTRRGRNRDYDLWLSHRALVRKGESPNAMPIAPSAFWLAQMRLRRDGITPRRCPRDNQPREGIESIAVLDPTPRWASSTVYFLPLVERLRAEGATVQAASYDWRVGPYGMARRFSYFAGLKTALESLVGGHPENRPAAVITHSMGSRVFQYFLADLCQADPWGAETWIARHIGRFIAVSAPWLGVPKSLREALTDVQALGLTAISGVEPLYRSWGALPWLLPVTEAQFPDMNAAAFAFLEDEDHPLGIAEALATGGATDTLRFRREYYEADPRFTTPGGACGDLAVRPPPVPRLDVLHATGQPTEVGAYYRRVGSHRFELDLDAKGRDPNFEVSAGLRLEVAGRTHQRIDGSYGSGDSFLPYGSLTYFKTWQTEHPERAITSRAFPGETHYGILQNPDFLAEVARLVRE